METEMTTELNITHHTFNWKISQFEDICPQACTEFSKFESETFTVNAKGMESKWCVFLQGKSDYVQIYVRLESATNTDGTKYTEAVCCQYTLSIGNDENKEVITKRISERSFEEKGDWGFREFVQIRTLHTQKQSLLRNGALRICLKMRIQGKSSTSVTVVPLEKANTLRVLSSNVGQLFNNNRHSDVEILCGDETFYAHKAILSARSTVFLAMFESDVEETATSKIVLTEINASVLRAILRYIYTGTAEVNDINSYIDLIYGAEKYDLPELKEHCFELLCDSVTIATIGDLAVAAETCNADDEVKEFIKNFFLRNIDEAIKDPQVKSLLISNPKAFF